MRCMVVGMNNFRTSLFSHVHLCLRLRSDRAGSDPRSLLPRRPRRCPQLLCRRTWRAGRAKFSANRKGQSYALDGTKPPRPARGGRRDISHTPANRGQLPLDSRLRFEGRQRERGARLPGRPRRHGLPSRRRRRAATGRARIRLVVRPAGGGCPALLRPGSREHVPQ